MFAATHLVGFGAGGSGFSVLGVDFDGTNDYLTRGAGWTGAADSTTGIFSGWFRLDGGDSTAMEVLDPTDTGASFCRIFRHSDNKFYVNLSTGSQTFIFSTVATYTTSSTWLHVISAWDTNFGMGAKIFQLYVNGLSDVALVTDNGGAFTPDYTHSDWAIGNKLGTTGGGLFNGCMAELYLALGQYLDISNSANRTKFISGGKPVDLGINGSLPTGVVPTFYLSVRSGDPASALATNRGSGGNLSITGSLDLASSNPSD